MSHFFFVFYSLIKIRENKIETKSIVFNSKTKMYEETKAVLKKSQKEIKKYADRNRKEVVEYKVGDRVLLSTKDLTWQMRNSKTKKLMEKFVGLYKIKKIISENTVELELPASMKIHSVVNVSRIALY